MNRGDSIAFGGCRPILRIGQRVLGDSRPERRDGAGIRPKTHIGSYVFWVGRDPLKALKSPIR
jgi:hypothetical protein